jgi:hypothetical protein
MNMTPNDLRTEVSTCKSSRTQPENNEACIARIQALTVKETTSKAHMQVHTNKGSREKQPRRKPGPNRDELGLGRQAWADRPSLIRARFASPYCPRCLSINCLYLRRPPHPSFHQRAAETNRRPPRVLELPRRWLRPCPSRHGWPCLVKPWWSSGAVT